MITVFAELWNFQLHRFGLKKIGECQTSRRNSNSTGGQLAELNFWKKLLGWRKKIGPRKNAVLSRCVWDKEKEITSSSLQPF